MAKSSAEGLIYHCNAVRYQVTGSGNLHTTIRGTGTRLQTLADTLLVSQPDVLPNRLANFKAQGMQVDFNISEINETFILSRIVAYIKPVASGHPQ